MRLQICSFPLFLVAFVFMKLGRGYCYLNSGQFCVLMFYRLAYMEDRSLHGGMSKGKNFCLLVVR